MSLGASLCIIQFLRQAVKDSTSSELIKWSPCVFLLQDSTLAFFHTTEHTKLD
jgi:hypothetical protein